MSVFDEPDSPLDPLSDAVAFELLGELERNTSEEIRRRRSHFRVEVKARITIQPGNASDLAKLKTQGTTGDLSEGGCRALFPLPVRVGDVYRLSFDERRIDLPITFARCLRCRLLREDAFEVGFAFFVPIPLPENLASRVT